MRKLSLPPVGALTAVEDIKPRDALYLMSTAKSDSLLTLKASADGVQVKSSGRLATLSGLSVWNHNFWEDVEFYVDSLNLACKGKAHSNNYNDAYLFRNFDLAFKYAEYCLAAPDPTWIDYPGGYRHRTDIRPFLSEAKGERTRPNYD